MDTLVKKKKKKKKLKQLQYSDSHVQFGPAELKPDATTTAYGGNQASP